MLRAIVSKEEFEKLEEAVRALYAPLDGSEDRFLLQVTPADGFVLEDVSGLKSALQKERQNVEAANTSLKAFEGLDPKKARDALARIEEIGNWKPDDKVKETIRQREEQLTAKFDADLKVERDAREAAEGEVKRLLIDSAATEAISKAKGDVDLLLPHVRSQTRVEAENGRFVARVIDPKDGSVRISMEPRNQDPMGIPELVTSMRERFPAAFEGAAARGTGAAGQDGGGAGGGGGAVRLSREDAKDPVKYRAAREAAAKAGKSIEYV